MFLRRLFRVFSSRDHVFVGQSNYFCTIVSVTFLRSSNTLPSLFLEAFLVNLSSNLVTHKCYLCKNIYTIYIHTIYIYTIYIYIYTHTILYSVYIYIVDIYTIYTLYIYIYTLYIYTIYRYIYTRYI